MPAELISCWRDLSLSAKDQTDCNECNLFLDKHSEDSKIGGRTVYSQID